MSSAFWADQQIRDDGAWYGPFDNLIPIPNVKGGLDRSGSRQTLWTERADGSPQAMILPAKPRSWTFSSEGLRPDEAAMIRHAADGLLGIGAMWWLSPAATQHNVLTPAMCEGRGWGGTHTVFAGAHTTDAGAPGWAPRTVGATTAATLEIPVVPVRPGRPTALSVFATGAGARISARWVNAAGAVVSTVQAGAASSSAALTRLGGVLTPPATARGVRIVLTGGVLYANPAVSWSSKVRPYAPGEGCDRAWLYDASFPVEQTGDLPRWGASFSVKEVA